ncbi:hypothetical protein J6590_054483 [Homalodisca vitripennis]|nr:hypothetical protein J6590_054483 [Homalodisca vitripennis]
MRVRWSVPTASDIHESNEQSYMTPLPPQPSLPPPSPSPTSDTTSIITFPQHFHAVSPGRGLHRVTNVKQEVSHAAEKFPQCRRADTNPLFLSWPEMPRYPVLVTDTGPLESRSHWLSLAK